MNIPNEIFLPYQQRWLEDQSRVRIVEKSRRIGFSWTCACDSVMDAAAADGCDAWYVGYNKDMAHEFIADTAMWTRRLNAAASAIETELIKDEDKDILTYTIRFASGKRVVALSSRPTNLRNKQGHIILDEAAHHDDLEGLIKAAMAVLMWGGKAKIDIMSTHFGVDNYFNTLVEETRALKRPYSLHKTTIDDALRDGLFKRICLVNGWGWSEQVEAEWRKTLFLYYGSAADEELLCIPSKSGGTYINRDLIERAMVDGVVLRFEPPKGFVQWTETARTAHMDTWLKQVVAPELAKLPENFMHFFGEDFGRVSDRTVVAIGYLNQNLVRCFPLAVELLDTPFDQQRQVLLYIVDRLPRFCGGAMDGTGNGAYLAEVVSQTYRNIAVITLSEAWYQDNLPPFKAGFEDGQIQVIKDADHLIDLSAFRVVNGIPKMPKAKTKSSDGPPRHGDAGVAYLLGHYASRQPVISDGNYQGVTARIPQLGFGKVVGNTKELGTTNFHGFRSLRGGVL